ncbi:hypothetical protein GCM10010965_25400 [Caldalkalibacillus thermarum]|uniref:amphi-Trp domain-containing protein n=1 Tax=Caldalkalibacillus thermarum TaxID=296745 RepID=UPI001664D143|nr:amphi-Trp domain-containing protein [Caldalkalibacillus thermarum]GGK31510.1 hypothetical protein GCM10010965_25400 [Caldalkalibacillus thermarum]
MTQPTRPRTEVLAKSEEHQSLHQLADLLETIAAKLKSSGTFTLVQNGEEIPVQLPDSVKTELEYTKKGTKHKFEIEVEWDAAKTGGKVEIR